MKIFTQNGDFGRGNTTPKKIEQNLSPCLIVHLIFHAGNKMAFSNNQ